MVRVVERDSLERQEIRGIEERELDKGCVTVRGRAAANCWVERG